MKLPRFAQNILWLVFFGFVALLYVVPYLPFGPHPAWPRLVIVFGWFFLFGMWAGLVFISESDNWPVVFRRIVHSLAFAALGVAAAIWSADPSHIVVAVVAIACAIIGFLGEKWVKHI